MDNSEINFFFGLIFIMHATVVYASYSHSREGNREMIIICTTDFWRGNILLLNQGQHANL